MRSDEIGDLLDAGAQLLDTLCVVVDDSQLLQELVMDLLRDIGRYACSKLSNLFLQIVDTIIVDRELIELAPEILEALLQHVELVFQFADIQLTVIRLR